MAGFEITVEEARNPSPNTTWDTILKVREAAVDRMTGSEPIFGIDPIIFRVGEGLPRTARQATLALRPCMARSGTLAYR